MSYLDQLRKNLELNVTIPTNYYFKKASVQTKQTVLLLHGYQDSASSLFKRVFGEANFERDYNILAPNGLFPVPVRTDQGFKEAYAWYFVDGSRKFTLIPASVAKENLIRLLDFLEMKDHRILLIGFSQGGILASFVAHQVDCAGIIGLGTMFFEEYYRGLDSNLPIDALHGIEDDVITLKTSQTGYEQLKLLQPRPGEYYPIANLKHTLNDEARKKLKELIEKRFK